MEINYALIVRRFEEYFDLWSSKVYQYAVHKTKSSYLAEETVQRVFIKLWKNMSGKNIDATIESQIFCITRTVVIDLVKAEYNRKKLLDHDQTFVLRHSPQDDFYAKQLTSTLHEIVDKLPEKRKEIFMLSRFSNLSHKEIADKLAISTKTVENQLTLALKTIRKALLFSMLVQIIF
ncbi:sigma-70 family RNA polymerase sigma factor [Sphingobacterium multivorum]|uniref:Sigma-70 family RNA polymerase sigma factor n=1 Tax=Sphingobacterium multivorum TaxID=28454 RepID=A0ABX7CJF7_SPHMU|nr:sigma-70 family RNA polymerase sigma factor [Sphingobacterium multivorum]QQT31836.1 sigma-70 family RNA polymerase sigma factor [Sphingobacterium multivorum]QQT52231.1 sigma-70 family RNA polymerase sigma factor [Sphingobacterium multivorum]